MGGQSETKQTQASTTNPWADAVPGLQGILGQLQGGLSRTGVTGAENGALDTITSNAAVNSSRFAPAISNYADTLFAGGGATDQAGNVNANYLDYAKRLSPTADGNNIGGNSGLLPYLDTIRNDATNSVNGSFAAAGRDFSGANMTALGRGIAQGQAPVIAQQYNTDVANQQGAADRLFNGGNMNYGLLAGMQQQKLANQGQGVTVAGQAADATNAGPNAVLQAEAARRGIPAEALGLLAKIGIPIAALGGQSTGQSQGTGTMSGAQQFGTILNGIGALGNLWPGKK